MCVPPESKINPNARKMCPSLEGDHVCMWRDVMTFLSYLSLSFFFTLSCHVFPNLAAFISIVPVPSFDFHRSISIALFPSLHFHHSKVKIENHKVKTCGIRNPVDGDRSMRDTIVSFLSYQGNNRVLSQLCGHTEKECLITCPRQQN